MHNKIDMDISNNLSPLEQKVFDVITQVKNKRAPNTIVRVVGGWVRDKMLGTKSDDIDLMVDNMSGEAFAKILADELGLKGPAVIKSNPDKTKNIETATMDIPIGDQIVNLDFAQCRTEDYGKNRREVIVRPATAEEDAYRRDLTIGALFYNINSKQIEDFTGKGIQDLVTGTIRTPFDDGSTETTPEAVDKVKQTFIDDPLRIFRAIRFAAKYKGDISPITKTALSDPQVIDACFYSERKISSDRISQELKKTMQGPNSNIAFNILKDTGIMQVIINESIKGSEYEGEMENLDMEQNNQHHDFNLWGHTMAVYENLMPMLDEYPEDKRVIMLLAAITHDLGKLYRKVHAESASVPGNTSYHDHERASQKISELLLKYLRFENDTIKQVSNLARYHMQPHNLGRGEGNMSAIRKFIRRMGEQSINWIDVITFATADAYSKGADIDPATIEEYKKLRAKMDEALMSLNTSDKQSKIPAILNGNEIMQTLGVKPGQHMKEITEFVASLRDENPDITKDEAIAKLIEQYGTDPEVIVSQAQANREIKMGNTCPQHLFDSKFTDINELILDGNKVEALSTLNGLKDDYGKDPKVARLAAINAFKVLREDATLRDNDLLQYIFDQTEHNFFDPVLGAHAVGLLLLIETSTEPDVIMEIGQRSNKLSPGLMRSVLDNLPKDIPNRKLKARLEDSINEDV